LEAYATPTSVPLQNLGGGYYQHNWKTRKGAAPRTPGLAPGLVFVGVENCGFALHTHGNAAGAALCPITPVWR
jgi:hypothetical protein